MANYYTENCVYDGIELEIIRDWVARVDASSRSRIGSAAFLCHPSGRSYTGGDPSAELAVGASRRMEYLWGRGQLGATSQVMIGRAIKTRQARMRTAVAPAVSKGPRVAPRRSQHLHRPNSTVYGHGRS